MSSLSWLQFPLTFLQLSGNTRKQRPKYLQDLSKNVGEYATNSDLKPVFVKNSKQFNFEEPESHFKLFDNSKLIEKIAFLSPPPFDGERKETKPFKASPQIFESKIGGQSDESAFNAIDDLVLHRRKISPLEKFQYKSIFQNKPSIFLEDEDVKAYKVDDEEGEFVPIPIMTKLPNYFVD